MIILTKIMCTFFLDEIVSNVAVSWSVAERVTIENSFLVSQHRWLLCLPFVRVFICKQFMLCASTWPSMYDIRPFIGLFAPSHVRKIGTVSHVSCIINYS
jgi:hypothetical protein